MDNLLILFIILFQLSTQAYGEVADGQAVNSSVTNAAFINQNSDDTANGIITLANTVVASGPTITNTQRLQNRTKNAAGVDEISLDGMIYTSQKRITNGQNHPTALSNLDTAFHETTGHTHNGTAGHGPLISASNISAPSLLSRWVLGSGFTALSTTNSTDVTSLMTLETPSISPTIAGVVVSSPNNKVFIRQAGLVSGTDSEYTDGSNNIIYGRLTESTGTWTLFYYTEINGVETAYTWGLNSDIRWYYARLINPLTNTSQVYDELNRILPNQSSGGGGTPGGLTTQVQYNSLGTFAGDSDFTWNDSTNVLSATTIRGSTGSSSIPSFSFQGFTNTGFYLPAADEIEVSLGGVTRYRFESSFLRFFNTSILFNNSNVQLSWDNGITGNRPSIFANGLSATADITIDTNNASGGIVFEANSIQKARIDPTGLNVGGTTNDASAILQADATTQGFLPPRMTNTQMHAISSPASGLMVYDTTNNTLNFYNGTAWQSLSFTLAP